MKAGKGTGYLDALPDMVAAVRFAEKNFADGKLIVWGSSYSAALVIKVAAEHADLIDGVSSFSPGEYFRGKLSVADAAAKVKCPVFITSAKSEAGSWQGIFGKLSEDTRRSFVPETKGNHGSRALWDKFKDSSAYWEAVTAFLQQFHKQE